MIIKKIEPKEHRTFVIRVENLSAQSTSYHVPIEATKMSVDGACLRDINERSRASRLRNESDHHASMEYAGTRYSK